MCNHERLLDYLYDELPASDRAAFEHHLNECSDCRTELAQLGGTRLALASWSPPESELGFRIVRNTEPEPRRVWWGMRPAWGLLAAAAVLVLAAAVVVANLEVRYDNDGFVVRTGWAPTAAGGPAAAEGAARSVAGTSEQWKAVVNEVQRLETRLRQLEQSARPVRAATVDDVAPARARMSDAELLRAVKKIIADSETRQQRELALRVTQLVRDFDATRAGDLARVEQGLRRVQGVTDAELIRQRATLDHLVRVAQR